MTFGEYCAQRPASDDELDHFARWVLSFDKPAIRECPSRAQLVWWATAHRRADPRQGDLARKLYDEYRAAENARKRRARLAILGDRPQPVAPPATRLRAAALALL